MPIVIRTALTFSIIWLFVGIQNVQAETLVAANITGSEIWRAVDGPFIIPEPISVESGGSLTIEPGAVVQFGYQSGLDVYGSLSARGTNDDPIYFISEFDTSFADLAPDEEPYIPPAGMWTDIYLASVSSADPIFEHVIVRSSSGGIYVDRGVVNFRSIRFEHNDAGLTFHNARGVVTDIVFEYTDEALLAFDTSFVDVEDIVIRHVPQKDAMVVFNESTLTAKDVVIDGIEGINGSGLVVFGSSTAKLTNSSIKNSNGEGIVIFNGVSLALEDVHIENVDGTAVNDLGSRSGFSQNKITLDGVVLEKSGYGLSVSDSQLTTSAVSIMGNTYGAFNYSTTSLDLSRVWWGDASGPFQTQGNPNGLGNEASDSFTVRPWLVVPPDEEVPNTKPTVSGLGQYMADGVTVVPSGGVVGQTIVFKVLIQDTMSSRAQLEVEIKPISTVFDGINLVRGTEGVVGTVLSVTVPSLAPGLYQWRARAVTADGRASDWVRFGADGVDFRVRGVPLYTQVVSDYPSRVQTDSWASEVYAFGDSDCGVTISSCGCAMTSTVMIMRYYDITTAQGQDVNPLTLNSWLLANKGYVDGGGVNWLAVAQYTGHKLAYDAARSGNTKDNYALLDEYLAQGRPVIARATNRGGLNLTHFFVIDGKQGDTYTVKDPSWYNTKTLNEPATSKLGKVRAYENGFDGLRLFYPSNGVARASTVISLASPAELLITDEVGRRLGMDPRTGASYQEIPNAHYIYESIGDPEEIITVEHVYKMAYLSDLVSGQYQVEVIGTGNGPYTLESYTIDDVGETHVGKQVATTVPNMVTSYSLNYDPEVPETISLDVKQDKTFPEARISFDPILEKLVVVGIDEAGTTTVRTRGPVYVVKDAFTNRTRLIFNLFGRFGNDRLKTSLKFVRYGRSKVSKVSENQFEYRWKKDKRGRLMELHQEVSIVGQGTVTATYSSRSGETRVIMQQGKDKKEIKVLPGLYLLSVATSQGKLYVQQQGN